MTTSLAELAEGGLGKGSAWRKEKVVHGLRLQVPNSTLQVCDLRKPSTCRGVHTSRASTGRLPVLAVLITHEDSKMHSSDTRHMM
jgi:hypothetical protein